MDFAFTSLFRRSYKALSAAQQEQIDAALRRFQQHPSPPFPKGWRVHQLEGVLGTPSEAGKARPPVWEMHAPGPGALVVTFQRTGDEILYRNCGLHDETLQSP